jgi:hypothetical protein
MEVPMIAKPKSVKKEKEDPIIDHGEEPKVQIEKEATEPPKQEKAVAPEIRIDKHKEIEPSKQSEGSAPPPEENQKVAIDFAEKPPQQDEEKRDDDYFPLPPQFRVCRIENPEPQFKATKLTLGDSPVMTRVQQLFRYQCAGPPYEDYMTKHQFPFVLERHKQEPTLQWGTRPSILPLQSKNKKILVIGNSHTRQMVGSLLCMYWEQIESAQSLTLQGAKDHARQYTLTGNHTLTVLVNPSFVYSPRWKLNLEDYFLKHSLSELDAIVLGSFNVYNPRYPDAQLWKDVEAYGETYPDQQVHPREHNPFDLAALARIYSGPIVWTSMTASYGQAYHQAAQQQMQWPEFQSRTNFRSIDGRQYVEEMGGAECGVPSLVTVGTCIEDETDPDYKDGHRCMGALGGPPDLVAWDVVEALWDVLGGTAGE